MMTRLVYLTLIGSLVLGTATARSDVIGVLDSAPATGGTLAGGTIYDLSTGGDSTAGIVGTFNATQLTFPTSGLSSQYWTAAGDPSDNAGFLQNSGQSATWSLTGLPANTDVDLFVNWRSIGQGNNTTDAPYTVNGLAVPGTFDQTAAPIADLVLMDPQLDNISFQSLGTFNSGALGQLDIGVTTGNNFTNLDAVAFQFQAPVPEPSAVVIWTVLATAFAGLYFRRRRGT